MPCERKAAFTLRELLVVIVALTLLAGLFVTTARGAATRRTKVAQCAANLRQLALACQLYANDNRTRLPVLSGVAAWAWDISGPEADTLLGYGTQKRTFYCPGTSPRFTDKENWSKPGVGANSTLWNFDATGSFHIVGYSFAFSGAGSKLALTNQNTTILPEPLKVNAFTSLPAPSSSERVLLADATISIDATQPGYVQPGNNYVSIAGGFTQNGLIYPHLSPHLKGPIPSGGNLAFKDGHVAWRKFELMTPRTTSGAYFWW